MIKLGIFKKNLTTIVQPLEGFSDDEVKELLAMQKTIHRPPYTFIPSITPRGNTVITYSVREELAKELQELRQMPAFNQKILDKIQSAVDALDMESHCIVFEGEKR